jgi:P-type Mg2+ transporter
MANPNEVKYWAMSAEDALSSLQSDPSGLTDTEAALRLRQYGENTIRAKGKTGPVLLFLDQFKNPIMLILILATAISGLTGDWLDSLIIMAIIIASVILSFLQEYSASHAIEELRSRIQLQSTVLRQGKPVEIPTHLLVPGDVILLSAGSLIPGDGLILRCDDFFVNQSILTGESFPVEKSTSAVAESATLADRANFIFTGTNVYSGSATALITQTGANTEFGRIAKHLTLRPPENEFERGVRRFGYLLTQIMLILTLIVFAINVIFHKPAIDSLLFSVALAVGITPQLLPAIINITLAKGSRTMAKEGVIVRRLTAMENFGSMDVLCTDKTGTLTEGIVRLDNAADTEGKSSEHVFQLAYLNSSLQTGLVNSLDKAIMADHELDISSFTKLDEIPYDFSRKRLSIIVKDGRECRMITKGALSHMIDICSQVEIDSSIQPLDKIILDRIEKRFETWSDQGYRVLGVAQKAVPVKDKYPIADEQAMVFMGFLLFYDPPKADAGQTIADLENLGIQLRIITGDNQLVALHTANQVGLKVRSPLTGAKLMDLSDEALWNVIETTNLFTEVDPNQKERIILALKKKNHVVGYMGDGINDAPALHAADVSISVNSAVDIAKEAADFVLLVKSLDVLKRGIELGRVTFANTIKYINITTSANFGNMFSMAGASLFMPFLPLLPKQILLINFITDFPALTLAGDSVDPEMESRPHRWNIKSIRNFMFTFGLISSVFDYLTFAVLLIGFHLQEEAFQSGWFVLSILTELMVLLVMRTQKPFFKSKPAPVLFYSSISVAVFTLLLPYLPVHDILNIAPIPPAILLSLLGIAALYIITTEIAKHYFFRGLSQPGSAAASRSSHRQR